VRVTIPFRPRRPILVASHCPCLPRNKKSIGQLGIFWKIWNESRETVFKNKSSMPSVLIKLEARSWIFVQSILLFNELREISCLFLKKKNYPISYS
jgi:hypothetical protein